MEPQTPPTDSRSSVDTSRAFSSVKQAVAILGERLLLGEIYSPKPYTFTPPKQLVSLPSEKYSSQSSLKDEESKCIQNQGSYVLDALKKLEEEVENTKGELRAMKERESDTEIALASLNAELHKNMSKLAQVEAAAAKKAAASFEERGKEKDTTKEEEKKKELTKRMENNPTLAHILSISEEDIFAGKRSVPRKTVKKKKPVVPLVGDWFSRKKGSSPPVDFHSSLYGSPHHVYF